MSSPGGGQDRTLFFLDTVQLAGAHPMGKTSGVLSLVKGQDLEAGNSFLSSAEVKNKRSHSSTPPTCPHGVERDDGSLTVTFTLYCSL